MLDLTRSWRAGVIAIVFCTIGGVTSSGQGLSLLRRATEVGTVRVLIENLSAEDAAAVDPQEICAESPAVQDMWFDALRLLGMQEALRSYAQCGEGVDPVLIEALKLPLTPARRKRIEQFVKEWNPAPPLQCEVVDEIFATPAEPETPNWYLSHVLMTLEADGSSEALALCERLGTDVGYRCFTRMTSGTRVFDTPESAMSNDPFLALYKARHVATSRDRVRELYVLDTLKRPHDMCRPVAVLASESGSWWVERVECETTSGIDR